MEPNTIAVDTVLIPPYDVAERCREENEKLWRQAGKGFRFDDSHLPHITLAHQFVESDALADLFSQIEDVARTTKPLSLTVREVGLIQTRVGPFVEFVVDPTGNVMTLFRQLSGRLERFGESAGTADSFFEGVPLSLVKIYNEYTANFLRKRKSKPYRPHITLGFGEPFNLSTPLSFTADRLAVCQLGEFWTCRKILKEWRLK